MVSLKFMVAFEVIMCSLHFFLFEIDVVVGRCSLEILIDEKLVHLIYQQFYLRYGLDETSHVLQIVVLVVCQEVVDQ